MPRGPNGEWRPADPIAAAVHVGKIATGQIDETFDPPRRQDVDHAEVSQRASKAGKASAASRTPEQRRALAKAGAAARWGAMTVLVAALLLPGMATAQVPSAFPEGGAPTTETETQAQFWAPTVAAVIAELVRRWLPEPRTGDVSEVFRLEDALTEMLIEQATAQERMEVLIERQTDAVEQIDDTLGDVLQTLGRIEGRLQATQPDQ